MDEFDSKGFVARVQERLDTLALSPRAASIQAGASPDLIRGLLRGTNKTVRGDHLVALARVLKVSESWLITGIDAEAAEDPAVFGVRFGGVAQAGLFRPNDDQDQEAETRRVPLPADPRYPAAAQYAFRVEGDSMTKAHIWEGMHVLAVDVHAWERVHGEVGDGKLVVVARWRHGDSERELTVKRLRLFRDRMELQPETENPRWQPIVFPLPLRQDEDGEAQIIAVVLSATRILT